MLVDQAPAMADQLPQLTMAAIRDEASPQHAVLKQVGDPLGILDVGLAPGRGLDVPRQAERDELLKEEKELTRRGDELARKRRELP